MAFTTHKGENVKEIPTNLTTEQVHAVLHSSIEGEDQLDPRVKASHYNNVLYFTQFGLPAYTVWCADAVCEVQKLLGQEA